MKRTIIFCILLLGLLPAAGCQSNKTGISSGSTADDNQPATINYSSMWTETDPQAAIIKDAVRMFEIDTGNKVNISWLGRDLEKTLQNSIENSDTPPPDIWEQDFARQTREYKSYMLDLTGYYSQPYEILGGLTPKEYLNDDLNTLVSQLSNGGYLGVPYQPFGVMFIYNISHFEQAGIDQAPETWEEFVAACKALKEAGYVPMTFDDAYLGLHAGYYLSRAKGAQWVNQLVTGNQSWSDDAVLQMAKAYEELRDAGYFDVSGGVPQWPNGQKQLAESNVSMYLTGTWLPNELLPLTGSYVRWGGFNYPAVPDGVEPNTTAMYGAQGLFINKDSTCPDEAFELLTYIISASVDSALVKQTNGIPLSRTMDWPSLIAELRPAYESHAKYLEWDGGLSADPERKAEFLTAFANLLTGNSTAEELVEGME